MIPPMPFRPLRMLDQLLLREFLPLFGVGILTFTVFIAAFTLLKDAFDYAAKGIPVDIVVQAFFLGLAQAAAYSLPMAVLLGALMAFGRLSSSGEITAMRAGGVRFLRIAAPVITAGYFIACIAFLFNELVAPALTLRATQLIKQAAVQVGIALSNKEIAFYGTDKETGGGYLLGAASAIGNDFFGFKLIQFDDSGTRIYYAEKATWGDPVWTLENVAWLEWDPADPAGALPRSIQAGRVEIDLNKTPAEILEHSRNPEEMSLAELKVYLLTREDELATQRQELASLQADPSVDPAVVQALEADVASQTKKLTENHVKYHTKIATPFVCVIFTLIAAPLGMNPLRSTSTMGFGLSFIMAFIYFMLTSLAINLAPTSPLPPVVLAWIPNALFAAVGLYLNGQFEWSSGK